MKSLITTADPVSSNLTSSPEKKLLHAKPYHKTGFMKTEKTATVA
jgi:hypothetical protein